MLLTEQNCFQVQLQGYADVGTETNKKALAITYSRTVTDDTAGKSQGVKRNIILHHAATRKKRIKREHYTDPGSDQVRYMSAPVCGIIVCLCVFKTQPSKPGSEGEFKTVKAKPDAL